MLGSRRIARTLLVLSLAAVPAASAQASASQNRLGKCVAFVKRLQQKGGQGGIVRQDLHEGLTGWIAMKARISPGDVEALSAGASPEAAACEDVGLHPEPLLALERAVANLQADRLRPAAEGCLAAIRVLDRLRGGEPAAAAQTAQMKTLGRLLGYVAKERKPDAATVDARVEALQREAGSAPWGSLAFVQAIQGCEPLGVDVDLLRRTHGAS